MRRRDFLAVGCVYSASAFAGVKYPEVTDNHPLVFPRDHGAHPDYRQEWWYLTGWLKTRAGQDLGFQITFFRARPDIDTPNPSRFTPRQVILAHAALSDPRVGHLRHDERAARAALGLAGSKEANTEVWVDDWSLLLSGSLYTAKIEAREFSLDLQFEATNKLLLQGENGFSRKGNGKGEASYYYSRPQLAVRGKASGEEVTGTAWLDHEWSSQYMASQAAGWDWCGLNLDDGSALMGFRMRNKEGGVVFAPEGVSFEPARTWKSPRSGTSYPVSMIVKARAKTFRLEPLMDDQELDARASTGTIYWEGAVRAYEGEKAVGKGYLELTGYWKPMKL
ncbi:MAG TPA: lipocalin-like domain-containing protein [Burkholderiales bacterium]|nr:lipocalin-like domain-containing protein [Burkholderiales bacterium]